MNLNELAVEISKIEGKKQNLSIAQIKEVLKCLGMVLNRMNIGEAIEMLRRLVK